MIGHDRATVGQRRIPLLTVACLSLTVLLPGCTGFNRLLGMDQLGPDEFAVESRAPLTIPPEFDLRPPQPGAPRPQEITAAERAKKVIDTAGPGEPGKQATVALKAPEGGVVGGPQVDPTQTVGEQSLAAKLLASSDSASGGAAVKRETTPLNGVY
jgi:Protein of unknown function (DUF3035)